MLNVSEGLGKVLSGLPNGGKNGLHLVGVAGTEFGLIAGRDTTGERDVGDILNVCIEVLGGATGIDAGEEI